MREVSLILEVMEMGLKSEGSIGRVRSLGDRSDESALPLAWYHTTVDGLVEELGQWR